MSEVNNTEQLIKRFEEMINSLSLYELNIINRMAVERIRLIQSANTLAYMSKFHVGDRVSWDSKDGSRRMGIIIRLNNKTASIKLSNGSQWNISPHFLEKGE